MKTAEDLLKDKGGKIISVAPDTTIQDALQVMTECKIGAVLVKNENEIVGIWTERDLMYDTLKEGFDPKTATISDYMVSDVHFASHNESIYQLMDHFLGLRFRHMPVKKDGECIGILSIGDVMKTSLTEKNKELKDLNKMASWEYYENWVWDSKR